MPMPPHLAHLVNASLEVERARRSLDDEARQYARAGARNYTVDGMSIDALTKAGRKGVSIFLTDNGLDIVPIGDVETSVRAAEAGHPERKFDPQQGKVAQGATKDAALAGQSANDAALLVQQNALAEIKARTDATKRDKMIADQKAWARDQYDRTAKYAERMKDHAAKTWPKDSPVCAGRSGR